MYKESLRDKIYLAALLHDIGKFWQRADFEKNSNQKNFNYEKSNALKNSKNLVDNICPQNFKGKFGYQHVLYTAQFLENYLPFQERNWNNYKKEDTINSLSIYHHYPSNFYQSLISLADSWSSGIDRLEKVLEDSENQKIKQNNLPFFNIPLISPFSVIQFNDDDGKNICGITDEYLCFLPKILDANENIFPYKFTGEQHLNYSGHWVNFIKDLKKLNEIYNNNDPSFIQTYFHNIFYLLKKYLWCIPSASNENLPITSLFEHLKTTSAIAGCLFDYHLKNPNAFTTENTQRGTKIKLNDEHFPILILGGDLSGIQSFIYDIHQNKAANNLKGRSFYLYLLTEAIITKIIEKTKTNISHLLYSAGGKFYMLLPNTKDVKNALDDLQKEIDQYLWKNQFGKIAFLMHNIPFKIDFNTNSNKIVKIENRPNNTYTIGELWNEVHIGLDEKKHKKFLSYITDNKDQLFEPQNIAGKKDVCAITGEDLDESSKLTIDGITYHKNIAAQIHLGKWLKDFKYIVKKYSDYAKVNFNNQNDNEYKNQPINILGIDFYFIKDISDIQSLDYVEIIKINNTDLNHLKKYGKNNTFSFKFYGGNKVAENKIDKIKTFEELTFLDIENRTKIEKNSLDEYCHSYLAVLRMDVDNLGKIFKDGLNTYFNFAAYSTLSFLLDTFFSGYINVIRNSSKYKDHVNILYSGGDDLFILGRYDKVFEIAIDIHKEFNRFTGRECISLSGGIAITAPKFPISKSAEISGDAEHIAKSQGKNRINIFGITISWNDLDEVVKLKDDLVEYIESGKLSKGFLQKIFSFYQMYEESKDTNNQRFRWHAAYTISRIVEKFKDSEKNVKPEYVKVTDFLIGSSNNKKQSMLMKLLSEDYEKIVVAARWAELILRDKKKEENCKKISTESIS